MVLHDPCDVLLEAAKLAGYARREDASTGCFAAFVAAWVALRLAAFPLLVVRSTLVEYPAQVPGAPGYVAFNAALLVLLGLHCYWFVLIVKVVARRLRSDTLQDVREEDSDEG